MRRYVEALPEVLDVEAIRGSEARVGIDPLGGSAFPYWEPIAESLGLDLAIISDVVDPRFAFLMLGGWQLQAGFGVRELPIMTNPRGISG